MNGPQRNVEILTVCVLQNSAQHSGTSRRDFCRTTRGNQSIATTACDQHGGSGAPWGQRDSFTKGFFSWLVFRHFDNIDTVYSDGLDPVLQERLGADRGPQLWIPHTYCVVTHICVYSEAGPLESTIATTTHNQSPVRGEQPRDLQWSAV